MHHHNAHRLISICFILTLATWTTTAFGQFSSSILKSPRPLTSSQKQDVIDFVDEQLIDFSGANEDDVTSAMRALLEPMVNPESGRPFRLAYSDILCPKLTNLAQSDDSVVALRIRSIHLIGELATENSMNQLPPFLTDSKEAIRYAAACAYQRAFEAEKTGRATFDVAQKLTEYVHTLRDVMGTEKKPLVMYKMSAACAAAPDLDGAILAIEAIGTGLQTQYKTLSTEGPDARLTRFVACLNLAKARYINLIGSRRDLRPTETAIVEASVVGILLAMNMVDDPAISPELETASAGLVTACETILNLIYHQGEGEDVTVVSETFDAGRYDQARRMFDKHWLEPKGPIFNHSQYGFKPGCFKRKLNNDG